MRRNLAARAERWSSAHWKTATVAWLLLVAGAVVLGVSIGTKTLTDVEQSNGETARAEQILADAGIKAAASESVLVQPRSRTVQPASFERALGAVSAMLSARPQVTKLQPPVRSKDGQSALIQFDLKGNPDRADEQVKPVLAAVSSLQRAHPAFLIQEFGGASADLALNGSVGKDFARAEHLSVPLTFLILLLAFGAFVAAGIPVLLALSAVLGSVGLSAVVSHVAHASNTTSSVILLMGMAVGVDYSLFYVKREREEKAAGYASREALHRAAATSGQAVLISGATVLIAMAGLLFAGSKIFESLGIGAMIVVFMSMIGSLTVLPALLGKLADRVDRGLVAVLAAALMSLTRFRPRVLVGLTTRRTLLQRLKSDRVESRLWAFLLRPSLRHPLAAAGASASLLVVLALPAFGMHVKLTSFSDLPASLPIVQTYNAVQHAFPGSASPATVVVSGHDLATPAARAALVDLRRRALASDLLRPPIRIVVNPRHTVAQIDVPLAGNGDDATSFAALRMLRTDVVPAALGKLRGATYAVTGETAGNVDFSSAMVARAPIVFAFVLGLAFLLLLVTFRSIVIPLEAIALNLLSVGAAYGVLVWVFQDGHLQGVLGFRSNGGVVTWLPLFLFTVLFGLSMDYHVFIISRIREFVDRGVSTEQAVERGIRATAGTVTSSALVMVAVFAIFATLSTLDLKQMGVGLAVAVALDATIIRGVLLPATMKLLGEWNWYLPRALGWLPRLDLERPTRLPAAQVE